MNRARAEIFGRLKTVLDKRHNPSVRFSDADARMKVLAQTPAMIPKRGQTQGAQRVSTFVDEAQRAGAHVVYLHAMDDVPKAVSGVLQEVGVSRLKIAPHTELQAMDWSTMDVKFGMGSGDDKAGLSMAYAGVAETGTLVLCSGPQTPTTLNFLPDTHMVVLRTSLLEASYEDVWTHLRADKVRLPRTVNWITGPSRTADIEQTILMGAHGPRKLVIVLVDESATEQT